MKKEIKLSKKLELERERLNTLDKLLTNVQDKESLINIRSLLDDSYKKCYHTRFYEEIYNFYKEELK